MAQALTTNRQIDIYVDRVQVEADHHAPAVKLAVKPLANAVRAKLRLGSDKVAIYQRGGNLARTCWVTINGRRCAFSYDYSTQKIVVKDGSLQGPVLLACDNHTTPAAIARAIKHIWP